MLVLTGSMSAPAQASPTPSAESHRSVPGGSNRALRSLASSRMETVTQMTSPRMISSPPASCNAEGGLPKASNARRMVNAPWPLAQSEMVEGSRRWPAHVISA